MKKFKYSMLTALVCGSLTLFGCGGGGDDGGSSSTPAGSLQPTKQAREPLTSEDTTLNYTDNLTFTPALGNQYGSIKLRIIDSQPAGMATLSPDATSISVLKPGILTVTATDHSGDYQDSDTTFTLYVNKGINPVFHGQDLSVHLNDGDKQRITVNNAHGELFFSVDPASQNLIDVDPVTGEITPYAAGIATVHVTDQGNDRFEPATTTINITVSALNAPSLGFAPLSEPYAPQYEMLPWRIYGNENAIYHYSLSDDSPDNVINIDKDSGLITVLNVGEVTVNVTATNGESYDHPVQTTSFPVTITQGNRLPITVDPVTVTFQPDVLIEPNVRSVIAPPRYVLEGNSDAVMINPLSGLPQIIGTGSASITAIDDRDPNYPSSNYTFSVVIHKGEHPGITKTAAIDVPFNDGQILSPRLEGQFGTLTFKPDPASSDNPVAINGDKLIIQHAGKTTLLVTDSGGTNYRESTPVPVAINIGKIPHPGWAVKDLKQPYQAMCYPLSNLVSGNQSALDITANSNPNVADYDSALNCLNIKNTGTTTLTLNVKESQNYLASKSQSLSVIMTPADTQLSASSVKAIYKAGNASLAPPAIIGKHGTLSYALADGADNSVVSIDAANGQMTILNAGKTTVVVKDSGSALYKPAETFFNVEITPSVAVVEAHYPDSTYAPGKSILPVVEGLPSGTVLRYSLVDKGYTPVKQISSTSGALEIQSAGNFTVMINADSRNYTVDPFSANGNIAKADHPGLSVKPLQVTYAPGKQVTLPIEQAPIGTRHFSESGSSYLVDIDNNTGLISLLDYTYLYSSASLYISESGDENYYPLSDNAQTKVTVLPPPTGSSNRDITLDHVGTLFESRLNPTADNDSFKNLQETKVMFAGTRHAPASGELLKKHGAGEMVVVRMVPEGESPTPSNIKPVMFLVQRFDGCPSQVNRDSVAAKRATPQPMDEYIRCDGGTTNRFLTFTLIDDSALNAGNWQAAVPFVAYRQSPMPFKPTANGGCNEGTTANGDIEYCSDKGLESPSTINEWNRIDIRLSK